MLQRLQASINRGDVEIINMHTEGDGEQVLELFMRPVEKVLHKLIADIRLAGVSTCISQVQGQLAAWQQTFLQGTPTDQYLSISQIQVGEGTVPVAHISRKGFQFNLFTICVCISYLISCMMSYPISYLM